MAYEWGVILTILTKWGPILQEKCRLNDSHHNFGLWPAVPPVKVLFFRGWFVEVVVFRGF